MSEFVGEHGRVPVLATVLVGDDPASHTYVRMKANRSAKVGIQSRRIELDPLVRNGTFRASPQTEPVDAPRRVTPPCSGSVRHRRPPARSAGRRAAPTSPHPGR
nr:tetrahydrofolate dehydrogenase/cyclohydrolase catalytic domain-containing protein [Streptomyces turgidiscabies]